MTIEDIEKAVAALPPDELTKFRAWFERFEAERFDCKIERDAKGGKFDRLADEGIGEFRAGRAPGEHPGILKVPHFGIERASRRPLPAGSSA